MRSQPVPASVLVDVPSSLFTARGRFRCPTWTLGTAPGSSIGTEDCLGREGEGQVDDTSLFSRPPVLSLAFVHSVTRGSAHDWDLVLQVDFYLISHSFYLVVM